MHFPLEIIKINPLIVRVHEHTQVAHSKYCHRALTHLLFLLGSESAMEYLMVLDLKANEGSKWTWERRLWREESKP